MKSILLGAVIGAAALVTSIGSAQAQTVTVTTSDRSQHDDRDGDGNGRVYLRYAGDWDHRMHHPGECMTKTTRTWHYGTVVIKRTRVCR